MRLQIYKEFNKFFKDDKNALKQQIFLNNYVEKYYDKIDRLLLYHGIGTGKTRSSIIIAEKIMKINPKMKPIIILPARLKTNYIDELNTYFNNKNITDKYEIYSYEYITNIFKKSSNINKTLNDLTENRIIIIDEFHNLVGNNIKEEDIDYIHKNNKISCLWSFSIKLKNSFFSKIQISSPKILFFIFFLQKI